MIARELERRGIATLCLSSAYSITASVKPPRAVYVDFPLGHTAGKPGDKALQRRIMIDALNALETILEPGSIRILDYRWSDDDAWKDRVMRPAPRDSGGSEGAHRDDRVERHDRPQYQTDDDRLAAEAELARNGCPSCVFPKAP
ncbi:MAG: hypothetical protein R3E86_17645 [Pseudomonadales bacterium]